MLRHIGSKLITKFNQPLRRTLYQQQTEPIKFDTDIRLLFGGYAGSMIGFILTGLNTLNYNDSVKDAKLRISSTEAGFMGFKGIIVGGFTGSVLTVFYPYTICLACFCGMIEYENRCALREQNLKIKGK